MIEKQESPIELAFTKDMQESFYVEELEDRFEMATAPNGVCWITELN